MHHPPKRMLIIFDLDGTLADDSHRHHYLDGEKRDWDSYFAACSFDTPIQPIVKVLSALRVHYMGCRVEIWTGRSDKYLVPTEVWLERHKITYSSLRMRPEGDYRPDTQLKGDWLAECGKDRPALVFDDRTRSVAWWREQGIMCC